VSLAKEEYIQLRWEANYWKVQHAGAVKREKQLKSENAKLRAQVRDLENQLWGRKSEQGRNQRFSSGQASGRPRGQPKGQPGHGRRALVGLPVREQLVDLEEAQKRCPQCGLPLETFPKTEDAEVAEIEVRAYRRLIRRRQYRVACRCGVLPGLVTAPLPARLMAKGKLGISAWVEILLDKFYYCRPTRRLLQQWRDYGLALSPGTVAGGMRRLQGLFLPLVEAICTQQLSEDRWQADETPLPVFVPLEGKAGHGWHLWVFLSASTVVYRLQPSRSSQVPESHFGGAQGILLSDRYGVYKKLARRKQGRIRQALCWAHVRRDFCRLAQAHPHLQDWAEVWIQRIGQLFHYNQLRLAARDQPFAFAQAHRKLRVAVKQLGEECQRQHHCLSLAPPCRKILKSLVRHWAGLTVFVDHPEVAMDNNAAERALRNPVVGRKNYYGSGSRWSAQLAANLFTLFQTLQVNELNPRLWLRDYLHSCAQQAGEPPPDLRPFLPWKMSPKRQAALRLGPPEAR
jgi:transposase